MESDDCVGVSMEVVHEFHDFFSVSVVAVDCWPPTSFRVTRMVESITYSTLDRMSVVYVSRLPDNHKPPKGPEHAPHDWTSPIYGQQTQQQATQESTAPLLPPAKKQQVQAITCTFLYYGLGIDLTILVTLNKIGCQQSTATTDTDKNA